MIELFPGLNVKLLKYSTLKVYNIW